MAMTTAGPEYEQVEQPLLRQLTRLGWAHLEGAPPRAAVPDNPAASGRSAFSEVFMEEWLREQLRRINRGPDGRPWLDDARASQAVGALTRLSAPSLLEANLRATELLLTGITVEGLPGWSGGRDQRVHELRPRSDGLRTRRAGTAHRSRRRRPRRCNGRRHPACPPDTCRRWTAPDDPDIVSGPRARVDHGP